MFHHLLVPLDGSRMSESILPTAAQLARRSGAALTLVHVIEKHAPSAIHSERHLVTADEATDYLAEVARMPVLAGLRVDTHVHEAGVRDVARSITEHTAELAPDLVVMSTHGTGGARRMLFGTIAQQVIAQGATPVLLARPGREGSTTEPREWSIIVAPLDGNPSHEKGLPLAAELAAAFRCRLHLLMVTPHAAELSGLEKAAGVLLPGATRLKLEMDSAGAPGRAGHLRGVTRGPRARHRAHHAETLRGPCRHGHSWEGRHDWFLRRKRGRTSHRPGPYPSAPRASSGLSRESDSTRLPVRSVRTRPVRLSRPSLV
jgi:nucleotide-binding universal stress UspA family protein